MLHQLSGSDLQQWIEGIGAPVFMIDIQPGDDFVYSACNARVERYSGLRMQDLVGKRPDDLLPAEQAALVKRRYRECIATREPLEFEERLDLPSSSKWWRVVLTPLMDEHKRVARLFGTAYDITREKVAAQELRLKDLLLRAQQDLTPDGVMIADVDGNILFWNKQFKRLFGLDDEQMRRGRSATMPIVMDRLAEPEAFQRCVESLYQHVDQSLDGFEMRLKDGRSYVVYSRGLVDEASVGRSRIWYVRDVTRSRQRELELHEALGLQRAIFHSAGQAIFTVDRDAVITSFNPAAERLLGYRAEEVVDQFKPMAFHDPQEIEQRRVALGERLGRQAARDEVFQIECLRRGEVSVQEWHYVAKDGRRIPVELTLTSLRDAHGEHTGTLAVVSDISERKAHEQQLRELATRDGLTGLWNRRHFEEVIGPVLQRARRDQEPLSVLMLDVDHFKQINDTYGHLFGDAALQEVANALPCCLRGSDLWCRWGGEEFAIALVNTAADSAVHVAERVRAAIEALELTHEGRRLQMTVSIGVSSWQRQDETLEQAFRRADEALYQAKGAGRNCVRCVDPGQS